MLSDKEAKHLAAILGMMGSSSDGESLNAARLAVAFVHQRQLTWDKIICSVTAQVGPVNVNNKVYGDHSPFAEPPSSRHHGKPAKELSKEILATGIILTDKELSFVEDMLQWARPTPKQMEWLKTIHRRACGT